MNNRQIAVLGAGGHTGKFVVRQLAEGGFVPVAATRDGAGESRRIDFGDAKSVDGAIAGCEAVINCAGPFFDTAGPAVEAALRARIPYLDVCAEQETVRRVFRHYDEPARTLGVSILPAVAFFGGLADLLVTAASKGLGPVETVEIAVGLDGWRPTRGTRLTGKQNTFPRVIVRDGALSPVPNPPPSRDWTYSQLLGTQRVTCVPLSEIILLNWHMGAKSITSYMNEKPLSDLKEASTPPPEAIDSTGRSAQRFVVEAEVKGSSGTALISAKGQDIYAVSAPLVVSALEKVLKWEKPRAGVFAPGEVFDVDAFLAQLTPRFLESIHHHTE